MIDIAELRRLLDAMTPPPWRTEQGEGQIARIVIDGQDFPEFAHHNPENAEGIVALVNAAPQLVEEVTKLRAEVDTLRRERDELRAAPCTYEKEHHACQCCGFVEMLEGKLAAVRALRDEMKRNGDCGYTEALDEALGDSA